LEQSLALAGSHVVWLGGGSVALPWPSAPLPGTNCRRPCNPGSKRKGLGPFFTPNTSSISPPGEDQASDRTHRIGQTRPVTVYRLIARHTIKEKVIQLHGQKRELAETILSGGETTAFTQKEVLARAAAGRLELQFGFGEPRSLRLSLQSGQLSS